MRAPSRARLHATLLVATGLLVNPALTGGAIALTRGAMAQDASPYVPLGYWGTPYLEHLIARGAIADPTPLTRPFVQADVVRALAAADTARLSGAERRVVRDILADLRRDNPDQKPWARVDGSVAVSGASHARRDPLRAAGTGHATVAGGLAGQALLGPVALVTHPYFVVHRLLWRPGGAGTALGLWEGEIAAGPARTLEPWFANVLNLGLLVEYDRNVSVNSLLGADFETRLGRSKLFAQLLLDDIQIDRATAADSEPAAYGLTLGATTVVRDVVLTGYYTRVANLTYRTPNPAETVESRFVGLGRNFSDYEQATLVASLVAGPGVLLAPEATLLRQGQGDFRDPYPPVAAYGSTPTIFSGIVERTVRLAAGVAWQRGPWGLSGNGGVHFIHNAGHVAGASDTKWVGSVTLSYRFHVQGALP